MGVNCWASQHRPRSLLISAGDNDLGDDGRQSQGKLLPKSKNTQGRSVDRKLGVDQTPVLQAENQTREFGGGAGLKTPLGCNKIEQIENDGAQPNNIVSQINFNGSTTNTRVH
jgi:hypothetical protein